MKVTISHEKLRKFTSAAQKELHDKFGVTLIR